MKESRTYKPVAQTSSMRRAPRGPRMEPHSCNHATAPELLANSLRMMRDAGLKKTTPRTQLLKIMADFEQPFSADDIARNSKSKVRHQTAFDLVTIYRNLATFSEIGVLSRVDLGDSVVRYELRDPSGHHHHHIVCTECRKTEPLDLCSTGSAIETPLAIESLRLSKLGYQNLTHRLEFSGLCPTCATSNATSNSKTNAKSIAKPTSKLTAKP